MEQIDAITMEVIRYRLVSSIRDMTETMKRAAMSSIIYDVLDFSNALVDKNNEVVVQELGIPMFLGMMGLNQKLMIENIGGIDKIAPGDVLIANDPFQIMNTHVNDIHVTYPVFHDDKLVLFVGSKAHMTDIGSKDPGSWSADSTNIFQEGIRIPCLKLYDQGKFDKNLMDIIAFNTRLPEHTRNDINAEVMACRMAEARVLKIVEKYGLDTLNAAMGAVLDHSERVMRSRIERIPDGTYQAEDYIDDDGVSGEPIKIRVKINVKGSDVTVDLSGCDKQQVGSAGNTTYGATVSCVKDAFKMLLEPELPSNEGCFRSIRVIAPEGTCVNAVWPAAVTVGVGDVTQIVMDCIFQALAEVLPDQVIAGVYGTVQSLGFSGYDPRTNKVYCHLAPRAGGWGAAADHDGMNGMMCMANGDTYNIPCEVIESTTPLRVEKYELIADSGGPGKFRGGLGIAVDYRIVGHETSMLSSLVRHKNKPYGLHGGSEGRGNETVVDPGTPREKRYYRVGGVILRDGQYVSHRTAGGGGCGNPRERKPERVLKDVIDGYVALESAKQDYGVVIDAKGSKVDEDATERLRKLGA